MLTNFVYLCCMLSLLKVFVSTSESRSDVGAFLLNRDAGYMELDGPVLVDLSGD